MTKKFLSIFLCILLLSVSVFAENTEKAQSKDNSSKPMRNFSEEADETSTIPQKIPTNNNAPQKSQGNRNLPPDFSSIENSKAFMGNSGESGSFPQENSQQNGSFNPADFHASFPQGNSQQNDFNPEDFQGTFPQRNSQQNGSSRQNGFNPADFQGAFPEGGFPEGGFGGAGGFGQRGTMGTGNQAQTEKGLSDYLKEYSTPIISLVLLAFAFIFVIFYKRKRY